MNTSRTLLSAITIAAFIPAVTAAESAPGCTPSGTSLTVAAKDRKFDKDCLAAPAGQPFTIEFDNQDAAAHNVAIFDRTKGKKPLFKGELVVGPKHVTYSVPAQRSGTYEFQCEAHDFAMTGTFVVAVTN